jgi:hypothetical protein
MRNARVRSLNSQFGHLMIDTVRGYTRCTTRPPTTMKTFLQRSFGMRCWIHMCHWSMPGTSTILMS